MSVNATVIQNLYNALASGEAVAALALLDDGVVWNEAENFPYADGNPYVGPQRVAEGILGRLMTEWDRFAIDLQQIVDGGDTIVSLGRYHGVYKATGQAIDAQFVHVWTLRGGKVARFQQYVDTLQVARAVGAVAV